MFGVQSFHVVPPVRKASALHEVSLVVQLAGTRVRRLRHDHGAHDRARAASPLRIVPSERALAELGERPLPIRTPSRLGKRSARSESRASPAIATSAMYGAHALMSARRNPSTLTHVPLESLKSSASRPSKRRPHSGRCGMTGATASPVRRKPSSSRGIGRGPAGPTYPGETVGPPNAHLGTSVDIDQTQGMAGQGDADLVGEIRPFVRQADGRSRFSATVTGGKPGS